MRTMISTKTDPKYKLLEIPKMPEVPCPPKGPCSDWWDILGTSVDEIPRDLRQFDESVLIRAEADFFAEQSRCLSDPSLAYHKRSYAHSIKLLAFRNGARSVWVISENLVNIARASKALQSELPAGLHEEAQKRQKDFGKKWRDTLLCRQIGSHTSEIFNNPTKQKAESVSGDYVTPFVAAVNCRRVIAIEEIEGDIYRGTLRGRPVQYRLSMSTSSELKEDIVSFMDWFGPAIWENRNS